MTPSIRVLAAFALLATLLPSPARANEAPRLVRVFESQAAITGPAGETVRVVLPDAIAGVVGPELADLRAVRANGDIAPMRRVEAPRPTFLVRMEPGLRLCFGGRRALAEEPSAEAPAAPAQVAALPAASIGPVVPNPDHGTTPLFDAIPAPTEAMEVSRFSHLRTIDAPSSPDAVSTVALGDDVLRVARPDLGDIRIVDGLAHPVPFLIRRDGGRAVLYLTAVGGSYVMLVGAPAVGPLPSPLEPHRDVLFAVRPLETRPEPLLRNPDFGHVDEAAPRAEAGEAPTGQAEEASVGGLAPWGLGAALAVAAAVVLVRKRRARG
ncbi:MAG: hypothetical protein U0230_26065 [Polyangiales bacterium]